jgi:uncharacterized protein YcbK (DUF882 family)
MITQLTTNFQLSEFTSLAHRDVPFAVLTNLYTLASQLEYIRSYFGNNIITINSGYRNKVHNKKVGGVYNSKHLIGQAADIKIKNHTPKQVQDGIVLMRQASLLISGGLGFYNTFTHFDIRGFNVTWGKKKDLENENKTDINTSFQFAYASVPLLISFYIINRFNL